MNLLCGNSLFFRVPANDVQIGHFCQRNLATHLQKVGHLDKIMLKAEFLSNGAHQGMFPQAAISLVGESWAAITINHSYRNHKSFSYDIINLVW